MNIPAAAMPFPQQSPDVPRFQQSPDAPRFERSLDADGKLTRIKAFGTLRAKDILHFAAHIAQHGRTHLLLWDLREVTWSNVKTLELIRAFGSSARQIARAGFRTAFLFSRDADYGLGRVIETYAEASNIPGEYRPFKVAAEAELWLRGRMGQIGQVDS